MYISQVLKNEMEKDIEKCENYPSANGSQELYGELVAKYTTIDSTFSKNLSTMGKVTVPGVPFDFRQELKAIANKLKMMLLLSEESSTQSSEKPLRKQIEDLLQRGYNIGKEEYHEAGDGFPFSYVSGPKYNVWMSEIKTICERSLQSHPLYESIKGAYKARKNNPASFDDMIGYLEALIADNEFGAEKNNVEVIKEKCMGNKVFIVHGHDTEAKITVARILEKLGLEAVILHEQPDEGKTIIEKLEDFTSEAAYAIILYTECDLGRAKSLGESENKFRARQNVVFEHGLFIGSLGRKRVTALVRGNVEKPGDVDGVVYIQMDDAGAWKLQLCSNMKAAGLDVDMNKLI